MKRIFEHPAESLTGKRYWRSLNELADTPEVSRLARARISSGRGAVGRR